MTVLGSKLETKTIDNFLESKSKEGESVFNTLRSHITQVIQALSGHPDTVVTGLHDVHSFISCSSIQI